MSDTKSLDSPLGETTGTMVTECLSVAFVPPGCMESALFTETHQGPLFPEQEAIKPASQAKKGPIRTVEHPRDYELL